MKKGDNEGNWVECEAKYDLYSIFFEKFNLINWKYISRTFFSRKEKNFTCLNAGASLRG